jgi:putative nucleotidyltransferase with HDIG domain
MKKRESYDDSTDSGMPSHSPRVFRSGGIFRSGKTFHYLRSTHNHFQEKISDLERQLAEERQTNQKLIAINQFGLEVDHTSDLERIAQRMAKLLFRIYHCGIAGVYQISDDPEIAHLVASAGPAARALPDTLNLDQVNLPGLHLAEKWQEAPPLDSGGKSDYPFENQRFPSICAAPIFQGVSMQGLILLADSARQAFKAGDEKIVQAAALRLGEVWNYSDRNSMLAEFVQSIGTLSMVQETASLMEMIAAIARRTLDASITVVAAVNHKEWLLRSSGKAPILLYSLQNEATSFLEAAIKTPYTFRLRDLHTDTRSSCIKLDSPELCNMIASPIIINGSASFLLLAFGKHGADSFSDDDVFMAELLSAHAAQNLGSCFVNEKLRHNLITTQLLYDLSLQISQAENLDKAAFVIASTAFQLTQAHSCGLVLFSLDGRKEADVIIPSQKLRIDHPYELIQQAMNSRQSIYLADTTPFTKIAIPIQTHRRCYGSLWLELEETRPENRHPAEEIRALVNQSTIALERFILLEETRSQARKLDRAYNQMEESYDQTLKALMRTLDARDRETEGHSERVANLAVSLGQELGLSKSDLKALARGSLLHDIGKIGISDSILLKNKGLDADEWEIMRQHPRIGAEIIQEIPALSDALEVIAFHQERWNGSGYPYGLSGKEIPMMARIFAIIDVFDALTSDRPYRSKNFTKDEAALYLQSQSGILFDPEIVEAFIRLISKEQGNNSLSADNLPTVL